VTGQPSYETVVARLVSRLEEIAGTSLDGPISYVGPGSIRRLGLNSVQLLKLLVEIENDFGVVWDDDLDESVIGAIDAMARHIVSVASAPEQDSAVTGEATR
jgi:acyl carrier protein